MTLEVGKNQAAVRVVLLKYQRSNLELVADENVTSHENNAVASPVLESEK